MYFPKGYPCLGEGGLLLKSFLCHLKGKNNQHRIIYKKELCGTYKISWIGKAAECYATPGEPPLPISWGKLLFPVPRGVSPLLFSRTQLCRPKVRTGQHRICGVYQAALTHCTEYIYNGVWLYGKSCTPVYQSPNQTGLL